MTTSGDRRQMLCPTLDMLPFREGVQGYYYAGRWREHLRIGLATRRVTPRTRHGALTQDIMYSAGRFAALAMKTQFISQEKPMQGKPFDLERAKAGAKFYHSLSPEVLCSYIGVRANGSVVFEEADGSISWAPADKLRMLPVKITKYGTVDLDTGELRNVFLYDKRNILVPGPNCVVAKVEYEE